MCGEKSPYMQSQTSVVMKTNSLTVSPSQSQKQKILNDGLHMKYCHLSARRVNTQLRIFKIEMKKLKP